MDRQDVCAESMRRVLFPASVGGKSLQRHILERTDCKPWCLGPQPEGTESSMFFSQMEVVALQFHRFSYHTNVY